MAIGRKLHWVVGSALDDATLSVLPAAVATLPVENLKDRSRSNIMRVNGTTCTIRSTTGVLLYASGFSLSGTNFSANANVQLKLYSDTAWTNEVYDSGVVNMGTLVPFGVYPWGEDEWYAEYDDNESLTTFLALWFDKVQYRSVEIIIDDATLTSIDVARVMLGQAFSVQKNMSYGANITWVDNSVHRRTGGASLRTRKVKAFRRMEVEFNDLQNVEREYISQQLESYGKETDILICYDPGETGRLLREYTAVVKRINDNSMSITGYNQHSVTLVFEEV